MSDGIIILVIADVVWFVGCVLNLIENKEDKEKFITGCMALVCTPVGFLPLGLMLFAVFFIIILDTIPKAIYKMLNR